MGICCGFIMQLLEKSNGQILGRGEEVVRGKWGVIEAVRRSVPWLWGRWIWETMIDTRDFLEDCIYNRTYKRMLGFHLSTQENQINTFDA